MVICSHNYSTPCSIRTRSLGFIRLGSHPNSLFIVDLEVFFPKESYERTSFSALQKTEDPSEALGQNDACLNEPKINSR